MKNSHTTHAPRSWSATVDLKRKRIGIDAELYEVASVKFTADSEKPSSTDLSDAALLTAAPTLYAALLPFTLEKCERLDGTCAAHPTVIPCRFCAARAAIEDATYGEGEVGDGLRD